MTKIVKNIDNKQTQVSTKKKMKSLSSSSENIVPVEIIPLPKGKSVSEYKGYRKWGMKRWSWEFLRRNKDFRARCEVLETMEENKRGIEEIDIARDFGLKKFKHCDAPFGEKGKGLQPRFNAIACWYKVEDGKKRVVKVGMYQDQMIVRFDLRPVLRNKKALADQLSQALTALKWYVKEVKKKEPRGAQNRTREINDYLRYLRMLDLKRSNVSPAAIYAELYPDNEDVKNIGRGSGIVLRDKFRSTFSAAEGLAERGYLTLALVSKGLKKGKVVKIKE